MDSLLELFNKYSCHLRRGEDSMRVSLQRNFEEYILDIRKNVGSLKNLQFLNLIFFRQRICILSLLIFQKS